MGVFFGTDGLRGRFNDDLSFSVSYNLGNALGGEKFGAKILIGRDTRSSGELITLAFACGAMNAGAMVTDIGICPTAGISYLTQNFDFDFGVCISASHNPAEFNGIKIFDKNGKKIGDKWEEKLEKKFLKQVSVSFDRVGRFKIDENLKKNYVKFLNEVLDFSLDGKKIVIDCSNGASYKIARQVLKSKCKKLVVLSGKPDGININKNCGALHTKRLQKAVVRLGADCGFAFDGDSDRLIAVDENGKDLTGDELVYIFAKYYKQIGKLNPSTVVGTRHTNMGVEKALKNLGISLLRTEIGDKYVSAKLSQENLLIGGEQSGHIIIRDLLSTGDGILSALLVCKILSETKVPLSKLCDVELYYQENLNVEVSDKLQVINSQRLSLVTMQSEEKLKGQGRVMIRVSGTEPYIRIMVESLNKTVSSEIANEIATAVRQIDSENQKCVE